MDEPTVFYAWQNDTLAKHNRYFIRDAIKDALHLLGQDESVQDCPRLDHDTNGIPGTPSIAETIFEKISQARIFVADVSFVAKKATKLIPNPNVLIELGYALRSLSSERLILVMNEAYGPAIELPFDLRGRRFPIAYTLSENATPDELKSVRSELAGKLKHALSLVLKIPHQSTPRHNLKIMICPTRLGNQQLAQIRLFNSGPGPIYIKSWFLGWQSEGRRQATNGIRTERGELPHRIAEQDEHELLVAIINDVEALTSIGVFDGEGHHWQADENQLKCFIHTAKAHKLPQKEAAPAIDPASCNIEIVAESVSRGTNQSKQLKVVFKNHGPVPLPIKDAHLEWTYSPPRNLPSTTRGFQASEAGGSAKLSRLSEVKQVGPGQEIHFALSDEMTPILVNLLNEDVNDENIHITIACTNGGGWQASMDEVPRAVKDVAASILEILQMRDEGV